MGIIARISKKDLHYLEKRDFEQFYKRTTELRLPNIYTGKGIRPKNFPYVLNW